MKKWMTILVVFALCGAAMAYEPYNLKTGKNGKAKTYTYTNGQGTTGLTYTVEQSSYLQDKKDKQGVTYARYYGNVYFTTTTDIPDNKVLAVQFLGAEIEFGNQGYGYDSSYKIQDYGIYLYDPATGNRTSDYLSVQEFQNYFGESAGIGAGTSFGVYYVDNKGNLVASTGDGQKYTEHTDYNWNTHRWETTYSWDNTENGQVGNFDDDTHDLTVYDKETGDKKTVTTDKHFLCLSSGKYNSWDSSFKQTHWEFMLQTTLDDPYFPVNPNDFNNDVHVDNPVVNPVGQPLPGTLATLLIGGLCAGTLRKKNKKH